MPDGSKVYDIMVGGPLEEEDDLYEFVFIAKELAVLYVMVVTYVASICIALLTSNS